MIKPHIVILGAGFAGTYVAKRLAKRVKRGEIDVTIVNRTNYFLFTPLLHEVATGSLSPGSVAEPIREIFHKTGVEFFQGTVQTIDTVNRRVHVRGNDTRHTLTYDYLVIATGAESNYYNIPGAEQFTMPLKDLQDAAEIRTRVIDAMERAVVSEDPDERKLLLSFTVVGGGPTGVETATELEEFICGMVNRYYRNCEPQEASISLIHTGTELLQQFPPTLRKAAAERVAKKRITLILGKTVTSVDPKGLTLSDGTHVLSGTTIWAAGVKAIIPDFEGGTPPLSSGRLTVDQFFRLVGEERVYALGDVAAYADSKNNISIPMLAQAAVGESKVVAANIVSAISGSTLRSFRYRSKGSLVSLGQWFAVGQVFSVKMTGRLTWWMWRTVYLGKFASWSKRIRIGFEWFVAMFYTRDVTKLT
ncbi:MAG: NAD(P)/FAD-dependent oxidoreductase [Candidatus Paceibacterota bacterium]|jgi:NADH dehydrogenase